MFERSLEGLISDPLWIPKLDRLGFILGEDDTIRSIEAPDQPIQIYITNNWRYNELYDHALQLAVRRILRIRAHPLGVRLVYLSPQPIEELINKLNLDPSNPTAKEAEKLSRLATGRQTVSLSKPAKGPHAKIYTTVPKILKTRKRVVLLINDPVQPLGILSTRVTRSPGKGMGVNSGTIVSLLGLMITRSGEKMPVSEAIEPEEMIAPTEALFPGFISASSPPLFYSNRSHSVHTTATWGSLKRKTTLHPETIQHPYYNIVAGHQSPEEHFTTLFESIVKNTEFCRPDVELYIIANESGADHFVSWLTDYGAFEVYGKYIAALGLVNSSVGHDLESFTNSDAGASPELLSFFAQRTRAWTRSFNGETTDEVISIPDPKLIPSPGSEPERWVPPAEEEEKAQPEANEASEDGIAATDARSESSSTFKAPDSLNRFHHSQCPCHQPTPNFSWLDSAPSTEPIPVIPSSASTQEPSGEPSSDAPSAKPYSLFPILSAASDILNYQSEILLPATLPHVLKWFEAVAVAGPSNYQNPHFAAPIEKDEEEEPEDYEEMMERQQLKIEEMEKSMNRGFQFVTELKLTSDADDGVSAEQTPAGVGAPRPADGSTSEPTNSDPATSRRTDNPLNLNVGDRRQMGSSVNQVEVPKPQDGSEEGKANADEDSTPGQVVSVGGVEIPKSMMDLSDL